MRIYQHNVQPTNGQNLWLSRGCDKVIPPPMQVVDAGRPKKKRRREHDEPRSGTRLRRRYPKVKCTCCGVEGHNRRSCQNEPLSQQTTEHIGTSASASAAGRGGGRVGGSGGGRGGCTSDVGKLPVRRPIMNNASSSDSAI
ncbi:uncharacterized protein LOC120011144 [Tripterygium wilfordii]|uniref:uncharacterized protein LOC120011144 n=1 Tax=Tripterygium wilfordii TaxID=458696 RepID=UPI0018F81634|nr:uncharacterized protein LOC120011144 [Tripterygium wilfordii]